MFVSRLKKMGRSLNVGISRDAVAVRVEGDGGASDDSLDPSSPSLRRESYVSEVREREAMLRR